MSADASRFLARWQALSAALGLEPDLSKQIGSTLLDQYSGPDRHYHGTRHILAMLEGFDRLRERFAQPEAAELAIFFHDAIYDAARSDNEARSADQMTGLLSGRVDPAILEIAVPIILATKQHAATADSDTNLVLDLDMAILGQPWEVYCRYAAGVMREYLPVHGADGYRQGRPKVFLDPTIARGTIYLTAPFQSLNAQAIRNMERERALLLSGASLED